MSLYDDIGGAAAIDQGVDVFYRKMLKDDRVAHFFDDIPMEEQRNKQKAFLSFALGGPGDYTGKDMREGHAHLLERGLADEHVDIVVGHLGDTLTELGVTADVVSQVAAAAESFRNDILGR